MNDISRHTVSPEAVSQGVVSQAGFRTEGRKGPHQASTSLTPYGMSFWALILAACGGGGGGGGGPTTAGTPAPASPAPASSQSVSRSGHVYDGPVKGAGVYVDVDGDDRLNKAVDHFVATTNEQGGFSGSVPLQHAGKRYIVDLSQAIDLGDDGREGTEDDQDLSGFGSWLAPEGASVVSALTHLIATGVMTKEEIQSAVPNFDPLVDNPYNSFAAALSPSKAAAFEQMKKALPTLTSLVEKNRDDIDRNRGNIESNSDDIAALRSEYERLKERFENLLRNPEAEHDPVLTQFGSATIDIRETGSSSRADTGLRFRVTDVNNNVTEMPALSDNRFLLVWNGQEWQLWVRAGQRFISGDAVSLTVTASDTTNRTDAETVSFTVGDIEYPPVVTRTDNATLALDETTDSAAADTITGFEDGRDKVRVHANDRDVAENGNRVSWEAVTDTDDPTKKDIIIYAGGAKDADKILAVIEDFDAAGVFDADDFEPLAGVTFAEIQ